MGTYKYSAEFRADAVALARSSGRPISRVAAELGVNHETLRQWIKVADEAAWPEAVAESAKDAEIAALRKQVSNGPHSPRAGVHRYCVTPKPSTTDRLRLLPVTSDSQALVATATGITR
ncbi:transposase [Streptomyces mirabilis]|uniref:transposase n=1 Tax=Streptomyces mirabilis TaxID=68239 RepID=UPI00371909B5